MLHNLLIQNVFIYAILYSLNILFTVIYYYCNRLLQTNYLILICPLTSNDVQIIVRVTNSHWILSASCNLHALSAVNRLKRQAVGLWIRQYVSNAVLEEGFLYVACGRTPGDCSPLIQRRLWSSLLLRQMMEKHKCQSPSLACICLHARDFLTNMRHIQFDADREGKVVKKKSNLFFSALRESNQIVRIPHESARF